MHVGLVPGIEIEAAVRRWPALLELGSAIQISRVDSAAPGELLRAGRRLAHPLRGVAGRC